MKAEPRRPVPLSKGLPAALAQLETLMRRLGIIPAEVEVVEWECDHDPALGLRDVDPATGQHIPHQHDHTCLVWRPKTQHAAKTRGTGATTADSDVGQMRKLRQLVRGRVERGEVAADDPSISRWAPKQSGPRFKKRIAQRVKPVREAKPSTCARPDKFRGQPRNSLQRETR